MLLEPWLFSARRAWHNPLLKWIALATAVIVVAATGFYLWKTLGHARESGTVVLHYNIYLGIDDVVAWPWAFFWPGIWLVLTGLDIILAFGWYRTDPHLSTSLFVFAAAWAIPWALALYYLTLANV